MSKGPRDIWYWVDIFYIMLKTDILQIRILHDSQHDSSDTLVTENQHGGCWWPGAYLKPCHLQPLCGRSPVFTYHEWSNVNSKHSTRNKTSQRGPMVYRINNFTDQLTVYHYSDVILSVMASQITSVPIVYSIVCSGEDQRKHQSSTSLAFVMGNSPVNSPHKGPVTRKMFPFDNVIMLFIPKMAFRCGTGSQGIRSSWI